MGFLGLFGSDSTTMRDRIIHTQKQRIVKLEEEVDAIKAQLNNKHEEVSAMREKHESAKERLVEQIVDLSDKFAANHSKVLEIAEENARLKSIMGKERLQLESKTPKRMYLKKSKKK